MSLMILTRCRHHQSKANRKKTIKGRDVIGTKKKRQIGFAKLDREIGFAK